MGLDENWWYPKDGKNFSFSDCEALSNIASDSALYLDLISLGKEEKLRDSDYKTLDKLAAYLKENMIGADYIAPNGILILGDAVNKMREKSNEKKLEFVDDVKYYSALAAMELVNFRKANKERLGVLRDYCVNLSKAARSHDTHSYGARFLAA
jgi:hypothetical protein